MYLGFFKLQAMPFRLAPDPRFFFWSAGHAEARECLRTACGTPGHCAIITGERGTGKTALLEFLRQKSAAGALVRLDFPPRTLAEFEARLHEEGADGARPGARAILCDNAHLFRESMLAALLRREPPASEDGAQPGVILSGEPALLRILEAPGLARPAGTGCSRFHLPPLAPGEVPAYIGHRLRVAGGDGAQIFSDEACAEIQRETRGNPRLVNALCDAALMAACEREVAKVGPAEVRRALGDIERLIAAQPFESAPSPGALPRFTLAKLRLMLGDQLVLERELLQGRLSIGRSADNDLCIDSRFISRHHCRIVTSARKCLLEDVHSTNGLYVNDRRVRHYRMRDGDVVQIGEHRLHYADLRERADPA